MRFTQRELSVTTETGQGFLMTVLELFPSERAYLMIGFWGRGEQGEENGGGME